MSNPETAVNSNTSRGTALVTGASSGLGRVYADRLARRGYDLILVARRIDRLDAAAVELRQQYGVAVRTIGADLADAADLQRVVDELTTNADITMLVNNAGVATLAPLLATTEANVTAMNDINITALTRLTYAALPQFKQRDRGSIINIGSVLGYFTLPFSAVYSGTKAYVMGFTQGLQQEVAGSAVVVQLVMPSSTSTEIWELSGVPMTQLQQDTIMSADNCVDAALAGWENGELASLLSVEDYALWQQFEALRSQLFIAGQTSKPASRYAVA